MPDNRPKILTLSAATMRCGVVRSLGLRDRGWLPRNTASAAPRASTLGLSSETSQEFWLPARSHTALVEREPQGCERNRRRIATRGSHSWASRMYRSSLYRNSSMLMATTILTAGLGYLYWVVAARGYEAKSVGLAAALIAGQALTAMVCCLGIDALCVQVLPRAADDVEWSTMVTVGVIITAVVSAIAATGVALVLLHVSPRYVVLGQPAYFSLFVLGSAIGTAGSITDAVFVSARRSGRTLVRNLTFGLVKLPIMAVPLALRDHPGVLSILVSWVVANFVSLLLAYGYQMRRVRPGFRPAIRHGLVRLLRVRNNIIAHFLTNVGSQTPQFLLPLIVVVLVSPQADAYFYLTWSVGGIFMVISPAIASSLFAEGSNSEDLAVSGRKSLQLMAILLTPIILGALLLNREILSIFGPEYASHGTTLLRVLALSAIPDAVNNIYVSIERVKGHLGRVAALNTSTALITIVLTVVMVRHGGVSSPGYAWLIAQGAGAILVGSSVIRSVARPRAGHIGQHVNPVAGASATAGYGAGLLLGAKESR